MKKISFLIILSLAIQFKVDADGIKFLSTNWKSALTEAKNTNKKIFVEIYKDSCWNCETMASDVFPDNQIGIFYNSNYISVRYNVESEEGNALWEKYGGTITPFFYYINPADEKLMYMNSGFIASPDFLAIGKNALQIPSIKLNYQAGKLSITEKVNFWIMLRGTDSIVTKDVLNYLKSVEKSTLIQPENFKLMYYYLSDSKSPEFAYFISHSEDFIAKHGIESAELYENILSKVYDLAVLKKDKSMLINYLNYYGKFNKINVDTWGDFNLEETKKDLLKDYEEAIK